MSASEMVSHELEDILEGASAIGTSTTGWYYEEGCMQFMVVHWHVSCYYWLARVYGLCTVI